MVGASRVPATATPRCWATTRNWRSTPAPGRCCSPGCAASFLTETVSRVRHAGARGALTVRADSAFYSRAVLGAARRLDVRFSVTIRQDRRVKAAIDAIPEQAWTPIPYWLSTPEISGADVAETTYTCFAGTPQAMRVRLVVRRVRPDPGQPAGAVHHLGLPRLRHRPDRRPRRG